MITTFSVFGLVEDRGIHNFNLTGAVVSLEISAVIVCIPQTPFHIGEDGKSLGCRRVVCEL